MLRAPLEFDEISSVYDATREPLSAPVEEAVVGTLARWELRDLVEIGVGTGRVAVPLARRGWTLTGVDASRGMLRRAREKGFGRLVRANAYRLPFADGTFDAGLFVHVLHVLEEPGRAIAEACRVGRRGAVGLVRPLPREPRREAGPRPRAMVVERLRAAGFEVPERAGGGPPLREGRLLREIPPRELEVVRDVEVTEPFAKELDFLAAGASRWTLRVPPPALAEAVAEVRREVGDGTRTYRSVLALARWEAPIDLPKAPAAAGSRGA